MRCFVACQCYVLVFGGKFVVRVCACVCVTEKTCSQLRWVLVLVSSVLFSCAICCVRLCPCVHALRVLRRIVLFCFVLLL